MKRLLSILLVLSLMAALPALASAPLEPLSSQELTGWAQALVERALEEKAEVRQGDMGWEAYGRGFTLWLSSADLSLDSVLTGAAIGMDSLHAQGLVGPAWPGRHRLALRGAGRLPQ